MYLFSVWTWGVICRGRCCGLFWSLSSECKWWVLCGI